MKRNDEDLGSDPDKAVLDRVEGEREGMCVSFLHALPLRPVRLNGGASSQHEESLPMALTRNQTETTAQERR